MILLKRDIYVDLNHPEPQVSVLQIVYNTGKNFILICTRGTMTRNEMQQENGYPDICQVVNVYRAMVNSVSKPGIQIISPLYEAGNIEIPWLTLQFEGSRRDIMNKAIGAESINTKRLLTL